MSEPMKNPPVYFTVAQVRFNTLLKLVDFLPSIQDGLRKAGYPAFAAHNSVALQFVMQDGQAVPTPVAQEHYLFANVGQTHSFILTSDALTFQSTDYGTFELFSDALLNGLALVHSVVGLDFTDRVGLRYLDHVFPRQGDSLEQYLAPEALGLSLRLGGQPLHAYSETFSAFGDVRLRARVVVQEGPLAFPPDLLPQGMAVQARFAEAVGRHAILDTDGSVEGRQLFSLEKVGHYLSGIHEVIGAVFKATVTDYALQVWKE